MFSLKVPFSGKQKVPDSVPANEKGKGKLITASPLLSSYSSSDDEDNATPVVSPLVEPLVEESATSKVALLPPTSPGPFKIFSTEELVDPNQYMPLNCVVDQFYLIDEYDDAAITIINDPSDQMEELKILFSLSKFRQLNHSSH